MILHDIFYRAGIDGARGTIPSPTFIRDHLAYLESTPFDGLSVYMRDPGLTVNATAGLMKNIPVSYESISWVLAPLKQANFQNLRQNFAFVTIDRPADFFDDWSVTIQNFRNLGRAIKEAGLVGVFFDNEQYFGKLGNYPDDCDYPDRSLDEYRDQARLRGRQLMGALTSEFPEVKVLVFHGPYISEPNCPYRTADGERYLFQRLDFANELQGPLFAGMLEGVGEHGQLIDGGELKGLRLLEDFQQAYDFRKTGIASEATNSPFIPPSLRSIWPEKVSIAFHVADFPWGGRDMNPEIFRKTLENALRTADEYVWLYPEREKFLLSPDHPVGVGPEWLEAVRQAKASVTAAVPAFEQCSPMAQDIMPASGSGPRSTFTIRVAPRDGAVAGVDVLVGPSASAKADACLIHYDPQTNLTFLAANDLTFWRSRPLGASGVLENDQCAVRLGDSSAQREGGAIELQLALSFKPAFRGGHTIFFKTHENTGARSGYLAGGSWTVP